MASSDDRLLGCPVCGFRVSRDDKECPRCGSQFTEETRFECPFCGEPVQRSAKSCPSCHVNYDEFKKGTKGKGSDEVVDALLMEIIRMESSQVSSGTKKFSCPVCSWLLDGTERACPKCGKSFDLDLTYQCPICGALVQAEAVKCSECGALFEEEAQATREHEEVSSKLDELAEAIGGGAVFAEGSGAEPAPATGREVAEPGAEPYGPKRAAEQVRALEPSAEGTSKATAPATELPARELDRPGSQGTCDQERGDDLRGSKASSVTGGGAKKKQRKLKTKPGGARTS